MSLAFATLDAIEDESYIAACELVGPNAHEFEELWERINREMLEDMEAMRYDHSCHVTEAQQHHYRTAHNSHDLEIPF